VSYSPKVEPLELPAERQRAERLWLAETRRFLAQIGVPEESDGLIARLSAGRAFRRLFGDWDSLPVRHRRRRWRELCQATEKAAYATRPFCIRCGECCRRQTPVLHLPDLPLIKEGVIGLGQLLTLRRGERAYSPLKGALLVLGEEMVKIRPLPSGVGPFYDAAKRSCTIYERRPLQCRALKCWEPESFERDTRAPCLKRRDVLGEGPLAELVARHEREVDCRLALRLLESRGPEAGRKIAALIEHDRRLRQEAACEAAELDFLFGRPLSESLADLLAG
jgi:Fe-S-cluster containining protein